jgi:mannosyl-oligosaccharide alpha-1,2-mannosidase
MVISDHNSVGAFADSAYEYLLKQWLLTGNSEPKARDLCMSPSYSSEYRTLTLRYTSVINAAAGIINNLLYLSPTRQLLYVTDTTHGNPSHAFEHLSCFLPGLFALSVHTLDLPLQDRQRQTWAAEGLAYTCWMTYADQATGLGPDEMVMTAGEKWVDHLERWQIGGSVGIPPGVREVPRESEANKRDYLPAKSTYLLRPEVRLTFKSMDLA